jgi:hypothetical protein
LFTTDTPQYFSSNQYQPTFSEQIGRFPQTTLSDIELMEEDYDYIPSSSDIELIEEDYFIPSPSDIFNQSTPSDIEMERDYFIPSPPSNFFNSPTQSDMELMEEHD